MKGIVEFIHKNENLVWILTFFFVFPVLFLFSSDLIYADESSSLYTIMTLVLFALVIVFAILGFIRINEMFMFKDEGIIKRYIISWGIAIFVFSLVTIIFLFLFIIFFVLFDLFLANFLSDSIIDRLLDLSMYLYLAIITIIIPFMHLFTIRYVLGKDNARVSFSWIFPIKVSIYFQMIILLLVNLVLLFLTYEISMTVTVLALFFSTVFNFVYIIKLSQFALDRWGN